VADSLTASGSSDTINLTALPLLHVPSTNTLIQSITGTISGYDFTLGATLPPGFTGHIQESADDSAVQLVVTGAPAFPTTGVTIASATLQAGNIVLSGTNGVANGVYYIFASTNLINWTPIATNAFNGSGDFNISLPTDNQHQYFKIESQ
jgi:hypothetical protein